MSRWLAGWPARPAISVKDIRMMNGMGNMMIGMGLVGWLLILVLVLIAAAAIKYLFFDRNRKK
jgi:hypothetical protein